MYLRGKYLLCNKALKREIDENLKKQSKKKEVQEGEFNNVRIPSVFTFIKKNDEKKTLKINHINQFLIFKKSVSLRVFLEFICYVIILSVIYAAVLKCIGLFQAVSKTDSSIIDLIYNSIKSGEYTFEEINKIIVGLDENKKLSFCLIISDHNKSLANSCHIFFDNLFKVIKFN